MADEKLSFNDVFEKRLDPVGSRADAAGDLFTHCPPSELLEVFRREQEELLLPLEAGLVALHIESCEKCRTYVCR